MNPVGVIVIALSPWQIPTNVETWINICGGPNTSGTNLEELQNNNIFDTNTDYWTTHAVDNQGYYWTLRVTSDGKITAYANTNKIANLRCVHE